MHFTVRIICYDFRWHCTHFPCSVPLFNYNKINYTMFLCQGHYDTSSFFQPAVVASTKLQRAEMVRRQCFCFLFCIFLNSQKPKQQFRFNAAAKLFQAILCFICLLATFILTRSSQKFNLFVMSCS